MPVDPRPPTTPLNERGLRARFIPWSAPAPPVQQDRLRKCRLTHVARHHALTRTTRHQKSPSPAAARKPRAKASCTRVDGEVSYGIVRHTPLVDVHPMNPLLCANAERYAFPKACVSRTLATHRLTKLLGDLWGKVCKAGALALAGVRACLATIFGWKCATRTPPATHFCAAPSPMLSAAFFRCINAGLILVDVVAPTSDLAFLLYGAWMLWRHWLCAKRFCAKQHKESSHQEFHCIP